MTGETKNRWGVLAGLLLAMTLGLSGCGGSGDSGSSTANQRGADSAEIGSGADGGDTTIEGPGVQTLGEYSQYVQSPPAQDGNDTIAITSEELADIQIAQTITDQFWRLHWSELFTGTYTPPTVVGLYDGRDPSNAPTCAGKPLRPDNAFYCIPEDYVAWDTSLMERGFQFGDAWPYLVIAHEWSHAIANRLDPSLRSQAYELQADCLAGATLYGAAADGTLIFEQGDQGELVTALSSLGGNTPWTNPQDHGDSSERVANFNVGRTGGVLACLPSQQ
ncbi:hypothetical protein [Arthrobacter sp. NPDC089319]|uniref:hypothetical protein n=1 Tax=Arthrobacter sp. NPDC089319 TaxID=3155915 RepID=UPI003432EBF8